jgi:mRNA interferase MazF
MHQGEVYWLELGGEGSEPRARRPAVVVQHDRFNRSAIQTVVVAALTGNLRLGAAPGNVRLRKGEGNLQRPSVVNVTQLVTVDKAWLEGPVGSLGSGRVRQILAGLGLLFGIEPSLE